MTDTLDPAAVDLLVEAESEKTFTQWQLVRRRFLRHRLAVIGTIVLVVVMVACFGASWVAPYPRNQQNLLLEVHGPTGKHLFGVDELGRDDLTEVLYAGQISLKVVLTVGLLSSLIGTALGAIAGFFGKLLDNLLMRLTDLFLMIPSIAVLAVAIKKFGNNDRTISLVLAGLLWMTIARVVRGQVLALREEGVRRRGRRIGRHERPHHRAPHPAEHGRTDPGERQPRDRVRHRRRVDVVVPRFSGAAPEEFVGPAALPSGGHRGHLESFLIMFPGMMLLLVGTLRELHR